MSGVRRFIFGAIVSLDGVMADIERSGGAISGAKSGFLMLGLKVVAFVCDINRQHLEAVKVRKIVSWRLPESVT